MGLSRIARGLLAGTALFVASAASATPVTYYFDSGDITITATVNGGQVAGPVTVPLNGVSVTVDEAALTLDAKDLRVWATVEALRESWKASMRSLSIPLFFSPTDHLQDLGVVAPEQVREAVIGGETVEGFLEAARAAAATGTGRERASWAIRAHLVELADRVGDRALMSALARWQLVAHEASAAAADVVEVAYEVLGPIERVRLSSTLQSFGPLAPAP